MRSNAAAILSAWFWFIVLSLFYKAPREQTASAVFRGIDIIQLLGVKSSKYTIFPILPYPLLISL